MGQPFGPLFRLLLLTGCRLSEIAEMTRSELSDDLSTLHLPGNRTKNGRPHVVYLSPLAREVLKSVKPIEGCPYVFSTNGRTPVSGFSKAKARLDSLMTVQDWRLHDLRRTAATGMAGLGVPPHIVEAALNHVSGAKAGVAGTYNVEAYTVERKEALERWSFHVHSIVSSK
ncbi:site-specific integrase [Microvirga aerilata]